MTTGKEVLMKVADKVDITESERAILYAWASDHDLSKTCVDGLFDGQTTITKLSSITENFGSVASGEIAFGESGNPNTNPSDFTGVAVSFPGYVRGSKTFYIIGEEAGVLKFGLASDGSAVFLGGNATIDETGFTISGLQRGIILSATSDAGVAKQAYIQMKNIDEDITARPVLSIGYEEPGTTELVVDGTFESGGFSNWTKSVSAGGNTDWIEIQNASPIAQAGSYCAKYQDTDGGGSTGTLTSAARFAITAGQDYQISLWLWTDFSSGNPELCTITISFWAADSGGSAISTKVLAASSYGAPETWIVPEASGMVATAPVGANYASVAIGMYSQGGIVAVDNVSLVAINSWGEIILDPDDSKPLFRGSKTSSELLQIPMAKAIITPPLTAPTVVLSAGGSLVNGSSYKYKITYTSQSGETTASPESAEVTATSTNKQVSITGKYSLSVHPPAWVTSINVYRSDKPSGGSYGSYYYVGNIDGGTYTLIDDNDPAPTSTTPPEYNSARDNPSFPPFALIMAEQEMQIVGTGRAISVSADRAYNYVMVASAANSADGDSALLPVWISAGTHLASILGTTASSYGKIDWYLDDVLQTTGQDWYSAATAYNVEKTFTLTVPTSGYHVLRWVVNGKNGSSSDYVFGYMRVKIIPEVSVTY